jgi:hypothetical protein
MSAVCSGRRCAYLDYYAPIILKRADENNNKQGRDWITNFDFDQDGNFSNNRVNWLNIPQYVNASANGQALTTAGASGRRSTPRSSNT